MNQARPVYRSNYAPCDYNYCSWKQKLLHICYSESLIVILSVIICHSERSEESRFWCLKTKREARLLFSLQSLAMTPFFLVIARLCLLWPWQSPSFEGGGLTPFDTTPEDKTKRTKTIKAIASSLRFAPFLATTSWVLTRLPRSLCSLAMTTFFYLSSRASDFCLMQAWQSRFYIRMWKITPFDTTFIRTGAHTPFLSFSQRHKIKKD